MKNEEGSWNEELVEQLVAVEDARAHGKELNGEISKDLSGVLSCLDMLEQVWPEATFAHSAQPPREFLGRFEILEKLGEGGCGIVFLANDPLLRRQVALKIPRPEALLTPTLRQRFLREAKTAAGLNHPNLVTVFEIGEEGLVCYIASAHCPGTDLKAWLKAQEEKPTWEVPIPAAVNMIACLAEAIDYTHRQGVLHRDLKPSNVLLVPSKPGKTAGEQLPLEELTPRISDFGLAKVIADPDATRDVATRSGMIFGTPQYMPPEQAQGKLEQIGAAADIYSLGVMLFELLTGKLPFQGENELDLLNKIVHEQPPRPSSLRPVIHRDLETICLHCLHKDPGERYATAGDLARDLRSYLAGEAIQARRAPWWERAARWCKRHPARATVVVLGYISVILFCGLSWYQWRLDDVESQRHELQRMKDLADQAREEAACAHAAAMAIAKSREYHALLHRAGEMIASPKIGWRGGGLEALRRAAKIDTPVRNLVDLRTHAVACLMGNDLQESREWVFGGLVERLAFFPGGKKFAVTQGRRWAGLPAHVYVLDTATGNRERQLTYTAQMIKGRWVPDGACSLAICPEGRWLALGTRAGWIHLWDLRNEDGTPNSWPAGQDNPVDHLRFLPKAKGLISFSNATQRLCAWPLDRPGKPAILKVDTGKVGLDLSPTGDLLACATGDEVRFLDPVTLKPVRDAWPAPTSVFRFHPFGQAAVIVRHDKIVLVDWIERRVLRRMPENDLAPAHDGPIDAFLLSSDGSLLLSASSAEHDHRVKVWNLATGKCVASIPVGVTGPLPVAWCHRQACFIAGHGHKVKLINLEGATEQQFAAFFPRPLASVRFGPDGVTLATAGVHRALPTIDKEARDADPPEGFLTLWNLKMHRLAHLHHLPATAVTDHPWISFHPTQPCLLASGWSKGCWRLSVDVPKCEPFKHEAGLCAFSPAGDFVWGIKDGHIAHAWRWPDGADSPRFVNTCLEGLPQFYSLAVGSKQVLGGGRNGGLRILNAKDARIHKTVSVSNAPIRAVQLLPGEERAVFGSQKGELCLIGLPDGETIANRLDHTDGIESLAVNKKGTLLASGGRDQRIQLYRVDDKGLNLLFTLSLPGSVLSLDFHPDGTRLAAAVQGETAARVFHLDRIRKGLVDLGLEGGDWPE